MNLAEPPIALPSEQPDGKGRPSRRGWRRPAIHDLHARLRTRAASASVGPAGVGAPATIAVLLLCLLTVPLHAAELKFATWNLEWLTARTPGENGLPADIRQRGKDDISALAGYAAELDADVIAIQEVDGAAMAQLVFPPDRYVVHMTHDRVIQRVGLVVRRGISFTTNPDVTGLDPPPLHLRSGADITLNLPEGKLRVLAVHLKTGCQHSPPTRRSPRRACRELAAQMPALEDWIGARRADGVPFVILGDFNRWIEGKDQIAKALRRVAPLRIATDGLASPCWGGEHFIDHIMAGGAARQWLEPDSLRVLVYRETGAEWRQRLSDHCPVSVRFRIPD